ncbi:MAG TPA: sugar ABC transporter substrate-binding protein [Solirubrobacterales bacterium]
MKDSDGHAASRLSRLLVALAVAMVVVVGVTACGSSSSSSSSSGGGESAGGGGSAEGGEGESSLAAAGGERDKTIFLINPFDANPWAKAYAEAFIPALEAKGVKVTRLTNEFDPVKESEEFDQAISENPGAIATFAADGKAVVPSIKRAEAAGIPVFNLTANIDPAAKSALASNIISNAKELGSKAGELLVEGLEEAGFKEGNILALTGVATQSVVIEQMAALEEVLAKTPQYKIVETQDTQWDQAKAETLASQAFAKYANQGGIQGVFGSNDANVAGAIQAGKKLGLKFGGKEGIVAVGAACFPVGYENIAAGLQYGSVSEFPKEEGANSAELIAKWFNGESIPANVELEEKTVDKENLESTGKGCQF